MALKTQKILRRVAPERTHPLHIVWVYLIEACADEVALLLLRVPISDEVRSLMRVGL